MQRATSALLPFFLIAAIGVIVYSNSLGNAFIWDDNAFVIKNDFIKAPGLWRSYFTDRRALAGTGLAGDNYRPVLILSYALDYALWKLNPFGYHAVNMVLHIINALLVFWLISVIAGRRGIGVFATLIFLVHPIQTEAVTWISGRADVLFLFFYLLSFALYLCYRKRGGAVFYVIGCVFYLCSLLSKEMAVTLPLVLYMYDRYYGRRGVFKGRALYAPFFLTACVYMLVRFVALGRVSQCGYWGGSVAAAMFTMVKGVAYYIRLLLYPVGQCADYLTFPVSRTFDPAVMVSVSGIIMALAAGGWLLKRVRVASFGIFFFFVTLLPVMNIIPIKISIAERFLYLPSVGYAMALGGMLGFMLLRYRHRIFEKTVIIFLEIGLIAAFSALTMERNNDWANETVFFEKVAEKYPDNWKARHNLAVLYLKCGDVKNARKAVCALLAVYPDSVKTREALAEYCAASGKGRQALDEYARILESDPGNLGARKNIAILCAVKGDYDAAYSQYAEILKTDKNNLDALMGMGLLSLAGGDFEKAAQRFSEIISRVPEMHKRAVYAEAHLQLGNAYFLMGETDKAYAIWHEMGELFRDQSVYAGLSAYLTERGGYSGFMDELKQYSGYGMSRFLYFTAVKNELLGNTDTSLSLYQECSDLSADRGDPYVMLARGRLERTKTR
ncbi:MAG: tetratricopeptide repeat protein [Candidatus Omnitrophota bacterium]